MSTHEARMNAAKLTPGQAALRMQAHENAMSMTQPINAFGFDQSAVLLQKSGNVAGIESSIGSEYAEHEETDEIKEKKRTQAALRHIAAIEAIDIRIAEIDIRLDEIAETISTYTSRRQEIRVERAELEIEKQQVEEQKEIIAEKLEEQKEVVAEAEIDVIEAEAKVEKATTTIQRTQKEIIGATTDTARQKAVQANSDATEAHKEAVIEKVDCDERLTHAQHIKAGYERALVEQNERLTSINDEIDSLDAEDKELEVRISDLQKEASALEIEKAKLEDPEFRARFEQGLVSEAEMKSVLSEESYDSFSVTMESYYDSAAGLVSDAVDSVTTTVSETINDISETVSGTVDYIADSITPAWWSTPVEETNTASNIKVGEHNADNMMCHFEKAAPAQSNMTPIPGLSGTKDLSQTAFTPRVADNNMSIGLNLGGNS